MLKFSKNVIALQAQFHDDLLFHFLCNILAFNRGPINFAIYYLFSQYINLMFNSGFPQNLEFISMTYYFYSVFGT